MNYWRESSDDAWVLNNGGHSVKVRVRSRYRANSPEAVADAALAGLGIALLPLYTCDDALADGRLVRVLVPWQPATKFGAGINAVAAPDRVRLLRNRALLAYLQQACGADGASQAAPGRHRDNMAG
jgi:DNA-binding transcriptional LysR family regulator